MRLHFAALEEVASSNCRWLLDMMSAFEQTVSEATRDQTRYIEFLDTLLQAESDYRQERSHHPSLE